MAILEGPEVWLPEFARMRSRLYWLTLSFVAAVFSLLVAVALLRDAVAPWLEGAAQFVGFFAPGLPASLVEIAMMFPIPGGILLLLGIVIGRMGRRARIEEEECAFRAWHWLQAGPGMGPPQVWVPDWRARVIGWLSPVFLLVAFILGAVSLAMLTTTVTIAFCSSIFTANSSGLEVGRSGDEVPPCCVSAGARLLRADQPAQVVVTATRKRNETGLLLERGKTYTAKYLRSTGWKDGHLDASPSGVEFKGVKGILAWWLEWLRPYPAGGWFQVVGRIDREYRAFPVLCDQNACGGDPFAFTAPADGELVLLVNDLWYANNRGFMTLEIGVQEDRTVK